MVSTPESSEPPARVALIGAGRWGRILLRTITGLDGVVLTRLASTNADSAALVPMGCVVDADWRRVVTASDVDAVIVATPPDTHAAIALAAIAAGKPLLIEKPLTLDAGEAEAVAAAAAAAGVPVWVEHTQVFNPAWSALKAALPQVGPVQALRSEAGNYGPFRAAVPVLWDWGAHDVSLAIDLLGRVPLRCTATVLERRIVEGGEGARVDLTLLFDGEVDARILIDNLRSDKCRRFAVHGERSVLVFDDLAADKVTLHPPSIDFRWPAGPGQALTVEPEAPVTRAVRLFIAALRTGDPGPSPLALGVSVVRVLAACARSANAAIPLTIPVE